MEGQFAVRIENVTKTFGGLKAVDNVSLTIDGGEIFGIIGPNGAGKTTLVNMITGMSAPDSGTVRTLGLDPTHQERQLRDVLGVQFQEAELPEQIEVGEALEMYSAFYQNPRPWRDLVDEWGIADKVRSRFGKLSGGQKQRLFICLALLNNPKLVVMDELTTGLDPQARRMSWELIRQVRDMGTTVLLVTHFMDEAEFLCDRIALIAGGRLEALGTPSELTSGASSERVVGFTPPAGLDTDALRRFGTVRETGGQTTVSGGAYLMADVASELKRQGVDPDDLTTISRSLEDIFIQATRDQQVESRA